MSVAVCLLATSLLSCDPSPGATGPRLQPRPVETAALEPQYNDRVSIRIGLAEPHPLRFGGAEPDPERFGALAFDVPDPAIYGDYPEPPKYRTKREKRRAERRARREALAGVEEFTVKKTRAVYSQEALAYAAPAERRNLLASLFGDAEDDETPGKGRSHHGAGYDAVSDAARRYGPGGSRFEKLARDITYTESRGRCGAVSSANAVGVMQTKLGTARMMGYKGGAHGLKNCRTGAEYGVKYLAYCHGLAKGDIRLTSVCYNQGHGVLTNPSKFGKRAKRKEAVNYVATMRSRGWRM
jgi:soluble lytic murein transglycosylase-like protein